MAKKSIDDLFDNLKDSELFDAEKQEAEQKMAYEEQCVRAILNKLKDANKGHIVSEFWRLVKEADSPKTFETLMQSASLMPARMMIGSISTAEDSLSMMRVLSHPNSNGFVQLYYAARLLYDDRYVAVFTRTGKARNFVVHNIPIHVGGLIAFGSAIVIPQTTGPALSLVVQTRAVFAQVVADMAD